MKCNENNSVFFFFHKKFEVLNHILSSLHDLWRCKSINQQKHFYECMIGQMYQCQSTFLMCHIIFISSDTSHTLYVFSNCLSCWRIFHIGYMWTAFRLCEFSHGFSRLNCWHTLSCTHYRHALKRHTTA